MTAIRVLVAEDHHIVRRGLRALLEREPDISVVGEAADGLQAMTAVARHRPRVLLLDLMMPGMDGLEVARRVHSVAPETHVVIISMYSHPGYLAEALRAGVSGYVLKGGDPGDLVRAIRAAAAGRYYFSSALDMMQGVPAAVARDPYHALTSRERQVLVLVAAGVSNAEVAAGLGIAPRTAETHRTNLMRKLELHSQAALVRYALE